MSFTDSTLTLLILCVHVTLSAHNLNEGNTRSLVSLCQGVLYSCTVCGYGPSYSSTLRLSSSSSTRPPRPSANMTTAETISTRDFGLTKMPSRVVSTCSSLESTAPRHTLPWAGPRVACGRMRRVQRACAWAFTVVAGNHAPKNRVFPVEERRVAEQHAEGRSACERR